MSQTQNPGRQEPLVALVNCTIANMGAGNEQLVQLPPGAHLLNIWADTVTPFNAGTTATITAGDGTTTFINAASVAAAARAAGTVGKYYPSGGTITISLAETGTAATAGETLVSVEYLQLGRAQKTFG